MTEATVPELTIRNGTFADVPTIVHLWFRTWHATSPHLDHPEPIHLWESRFRSEILPAETVLVAELDGEIVGFMGLREWEGYLHLLYIAPEYHGRGVGSMLLAEAIRRCPSGLKLTTLESNSRARRFYERHGWTPGEPTLHPRTGHPSVAYHWSPRGE